MFTAIDEVNYIRYRLITVKLNQCGIINKISVRGDTRRERRLIERIRKYYRNASRIIALVMQFRFRDILLLREFPNRYFNISCHLGRA